MKNITPRHRRFVEQYCTHFNGARAAREAGYAESRARITASELLDDPDISRMVEERLDEMSMSAAEATKRMTDIAEAGVGDFFELKKRDDGSTDIVLDKEALLEEGDGLVKEIRWDQNGNPVLKLYDAQKALKLILEAHGVFNHDQRHEITGDDGTPLKVVFDDDVPEPDHAPSDDQSCSDD